ncbi:hypothetical protein [Limnofasciculus baicalensis]|uniref:Uncharacterized protein n=1 Tax=Limnofasciculus baicalensis BBK-W-15 TaxID=2699891 RepID=A0AAE3GNC5_9CYAN|nr:hypothetical protein [Limnofasciculus baicalensis]MCP2727765.1 hypothetical protein [Limnofasciculus baicalensis BBK-W-15]
MLVKIASSGTEVPTTNNLNLTLPIPHSPLPIPFSDTVAIAPQLPYTSGNGFSPVGFYPDPAIIQ